MKTNILNTISLIILILLTFCAVNSYSQSGTGNLDTSYTLLSSSQYDYKNPQFDKTHNSINYFVRDCIFAYEKWSDSNNSKVAVRFMNYNSLSPEIELGAGNGLNIKPSVAYAYGNYLHPVNNKGAVVYESNQNGNRDIFISFYDTISWSTPVAVVSGPEDETDPVIVSYTRNDFFNVVIAYKRGNDIFLKSYHNGFWKDEINLTSDDSLNCSSPSITSVAFVSDNFYVSYLQSSGNNSKSIIFKQFHINTDGSYNIGDAVNIFQSGSQENIRFSKGVNYSTLNYDYDTLGVKRFYSALIQANNFKIVDQTKGYPGINFGGTGSSHGDITSDYPTGYSLFTWIRKINDSTQIIITNGYFDFYTRSFHAGNAGAETFVNSSSTLVFGQQYTYFRIRVLWEKQINGRTALIESFRDETLSSVSENNSVPGDYFLSQNYPNPFNPETNLEFGISELGFVSLKVYDGMGREVQTLVNEKLSPGSYTVKFNGDGLASGIYFYSFKVNGFTETKRMILIK